MGGPLCLSVSATLPVLSTDLLLNNFAIRSFRDVGDADYITARMACRAALIGQFIWASQQAIEKYLKCALLLNRISIKGVRHDLGEALCRLQTNNLKLDLTEGTSEFIEKVNDYGTSARYFEFSTVGRAHDIVILDRAVWEIRRYCTLWDKPRNIKLEEGHPPPRVWLSGGYLEKIIDNMKSPAREPLLWQNGFFGKRVRRTVRPGGWLVAHNAPLYLNPQILDEVLKYATLPDRVIKAYRGKPRA